MPLWYALFEREVESHYKYNPAIFMITLYPRLIIAFKIKSESILSRKRKT